MLIDASNKPLLIAIIVVASIIIIAAPAFLIYFFNATKKARKKVNNNTINWLDSLGGEDNFISAESRSTRLTIYLKDTTIIKTEDLKNLGVTNIIRATDKITLVLEEAETIAELLNNRQVS